MKRSELDEIARRAKQACAAIPMATCLRCKGRGYAWPLQDQPCFHCEGSGRAHVKTPTVELVLRDDPKVAQGLSADDVSHCRYPLCKGGPMGRIVDVDPLSETGLIRVKFEAIALLKWIEKQA